MITACLFSTPTPDSSATGEKVSVRTAHEILAEASAAGRLRCCECLESVSLVHRGGRLNHFRHHPLTDESPPCSLRSEGGAKPSREEMSMYGRDISKIGFGTVDRNLVTITRLRQELEKARKTNAQLTEELEDARKTNARLTEELEQALKLIAHLMEEAHQAEEIIRHVEDGLKAA